MNSSQANNQLDQLKQQQQQKLESQSNQQNNSRTMNNQAYVKVEPNEGVLGSPINHSNLHQFKHLQAHPQPVHLPLTPYMQNFINQDTQQQSLQPIQAPAFDFNSSQFSHQRQFPSSVAHLPQSHHHHHHQQQQQQQQQAYQTQSPYAQVQSLNYQYHPSQPQPQPPSLHQFGNTFLHRPMPSTDSNLGKSPIGSRSGTPIDHGLHENMMSGAYGLQSALNDIGGLHSNLSMLPSNSRKRQRKSDHAVPGDDGDNELKQLAFKASKLPLHELALRIKSIENDDSIPETKASASHVNISRDDNSSSNDNNLDHGNISSSNNAKDTSKERQRQIFGMVWLLNSCESSATAVVPRNRIYARYVQICADNSLTPLSPASFGKLVRILFPNLTTRRLGMRGQSKYHYCGIKLVGDQNFQGGSPISNSSSSFGIDSPQSLNPNSPSISGSPAPTANSNLLSTPVNSIYITEHFQLHTLRYIPNLFQLIEDSLNMEDMNSPLHLPSIYPYLPKDTDYDIADTLYSLYKVHCTSIFESLRYMHIKKLFSSFASFNSILTAPVFKLYTSEPVLEWVKECDLAMYRTMAKMLTKLHLQSVPDEVLQQLKQVSKQYVNKLSASLQTKVPKNFMNLKLKNAKNFIAILSRLIKVIETGQSAGRILNNPSEKQAMIEDWLKLDINEIVLREVPCSKANIELLLSILSNDFINLLQMELDSQKSQKGQDGSQEQQLNVAASSIMNNCASFISSLPSRFSKTNPRLFILVVSNLLTTCLREISLNGGQGFGAWWIVRCWVDEYFNWCFELGGFLQDEFQYSFESSHHHNNRHGATRTQSDTQAANILTEAVQGVNPSTNSQTNFLQSNPQIQQFQQQQSHYDDNTSEQLRSTSMVDLLDGAYGTDFKDESQNQELILNYDNVGVENILGKNEDILG